PAARADDDNWTRVGTPARLLLRQAFNEPEAVVIAARQRSIRAHGDATDGADTARGRLHLIDDGERRLLVRDGQIGADEGERRQRAQRRAEAFRLDRE